MLKTYIIFNCNILHKCKPLLTIIHCQKIQFLNEKIPNVKHLLHLKKIISKMKLLLGFWGFVKKGYECLYHLC